MPTLTTVMVDGSTIYSTPQLFAAYRDQLGRPISRDGARAIVSALTELYVRDGYVKPEIALDDSLTGRGVLRVQVLRGAGHDVSSTKATAADSATRWSDRRATSRTHGRCARTTCPRRCARMRQIAGLAVTATTRRDPEIAQRVRARGARPNSRRSTASCA